MKKPLPIGIDNFAKIRENGYYYVDKTLNYADSGILDNYWINTSSNYLVRKALKMADRRFWKDFDQLVTGNELPVWLTLETSYIERDSNYSLWGLLVNSGYLTALERLDANTAVVKIPNDEVMLVLQVLIAEISGVDGLDLQQILNNEGN